MFAIGEYLGQSCGHVHIVRLRDMHRTQHMHFVSLQLWIKQGETLRVTGIPTSLRGPFQLVLLHQLCDLDQARQSESGWLSECRVSSHYGV